MQHKHQPNLRKTAADLVSALWMLKPEQITHIRADMERATDDQITRLIPVLQGAVKRQNAMLALIIKTDPTFPQKLGEFIRERFAALKTESQQEESRIVSELGNTLEQ